MLDTVVRQIAMLRLIPRHPRKIAVTEIHDRLADAGCDVTVRTIQRDLISLGGPFSITTDEAKPKGWSWVGEPIQFPSLDPQAALTFSLVERFLKPLLPKATLASLDPHFKSAKGVLSSTPALASWTKKVRILPRGLALEPPKISAEVQSVIYDALFAEQKVRMRYLPKGDHKPKEYIANPLGLVLRDQVIYLVCTIWNYEDVRQLVLHRIREATMLEEPAVRPKGFSLDAYIGEGAFGYPVSATPIRLRVIFDQGAAMHLHETPLSNDQTLTVKEDGRELLEATVQDTSELRWWLLGFGSAAEVLAPRTLRNEFQSIAKDMANLYK